MSLVGHTLLKRGFEAHTYMKEKKPDAEVAPWAVAVLVLLGLAFVYIIFMVGRSFCLSAAC